jgi:DNA-binding winged helix-turn-helix (wHTH) protein
MNAAADTRTNRVLEQGFQLGELTIDPMAGEVSGAAGREKLDPKVMDVLVMLAQHAGQVVLREDLLARLWPNTVVTDDALSRCIYELRRQLPQAGGDEQYRAMIETVPKRGYRLNGEITLTRPQGGTPGLRVWLDWRWLAATIVAAAGVLLWFSLSRQEVGPAVRGRRGPGRARSLSCRSST